MSITLTPVQPRRAPEWLRDMVRDLKPQVSAATQFICLDQNKPDVFGPDSARDYITIHIFNSESAKTTKFSTDGTTEDTAAFNFADGSVAHRKVSGFRYILVENLVRGDGKDKLVQTCYTFDKFLYIELRKAVGLSGY